MKKCRFLLFLSTAIIFTSNAFAQTIISPDQSIHCVRSIPPTPSREQAMRPVESATIAWFMVLADPLKTGERNLIAAIRAPDGSISAQSPERSCSEDRTRIRCKLSGQPDINIPLTSAGAIRLHIGTGTYPCSLSPTVAPASLATPK